jgi:hypothetical protein
LILSHIVIFAAGFTAGKIIDGDELSTYRAAHESTFTRFRRTAAAGQSKKRRATDAADENVSKC